MDAARRFTLRDQGRRFQEELLVYAAASGSAEDAENWAKFVAERVGVIDDGSADVAALIRPYVERANAAVPKGIARQLFDALAHAVEAQADLTFQMEGLVGENKFHGTGRAFFGESEFPMEFAGQRHFRVNVVDSRKMFPDAQHVLEFLMRPFDPEWDQFWRFTGAAYNWTVDDLQRFHSEYWGLTRTERAIFLDRLLPQSSGGFLWFAKKYFPAILEAFLPPADPDATDENPDAYRNGMMFAEYIIRTQDRERVIYAISAVIAAVYRDLCNPVDGCEATRFGYRLGYLSQELPGIGKLVQYGHSIPVTPKAWLTGMEISKYRSHRPSRADTWRQINEELPVAMRQALHLGKPLGDGSYVSNLGLELSPEYRADCGAYDELDPDEALVLALAKADDCGEADHWVDAALDVAEAIIDDHPEAEASIAPLRGVLVEAQRVFGIETDLRNSKRQEELIAEGIGRTLVKVGPYSFRHRSAGAFEVGPTYRSSLRIDGPHFNELASTSATGPDYHRAFAIAKLTVDLLRALQLLPEDHDAHGYNAKEPTDCVIGLIDPGGQSLEAASSEQVRDAINLLLDAAFNSWRNGYDFASSLKHMIRQAELEGEDVDLAYLNRTFRTLMSRADYARALEVKVDLPRVLIAVARTGRVHGFLLRCVRERLLAWLATNPGSRRFSLRRLTSYLAAGHLRISGQRSLIAEESRRRDRFYPDNPNPNRRPKLKVVTLDEVGEDAATTADSKVVPSDSGVQALRIQVRRPSGWPNLSGYVLSWVAFVAQRFIR